MPNFKLLHVGISAPELQIAISTMNIGVSIINADKKEEISAKLKRRNRFQNFILACGDEHVNHIVKHVRTNNYLCSF